MNAPPDDPTAECIALVREAVATRQAHLDAIRHPERRPDRLPHECWETWYARAFAAVDAMSFEIGAETP